MMALYANKLKNHNVTNEQEIMWYLKEIEEFQKVCPISDEFFIKLIQFWSLIVHFR
jgi:hypothetical protein